MQLKFFKELYFFLGLFLLIFATNFYFIFGNIGKFFSLIFGSLLIFLSISKFIYFSDLKTFRLLIWGFILLLFYFLISYLQDQETFKTQIIIFDIINYFLFISGFIVSKLVSTKFTISSKLIFFISFLTILSCYFFYLNISTLELVGTRNDGGDDLNPVGIAYANTQLFLIFLFLLNRKNNIFLKLTLIITLLSILIVILFTQSRGPVLFLGITILIVYYKNFIYTIFKFRSLFWLIIFISLASIIFQNSTLISSTISDFKDRFLILLMFFSDQQTTDLSALARIQIQSDFFANYKTMFFGKYQYSPYPHNQFIEIFMRWGIFGIPIFLLSFKSFANAFRFNKNLKPNIFTLKFLILTLFFYCYLQSMTSLSLNNNRVLWLGFGLFLYNYKYNHKN